MPGILLNFILERQKQIINRLEWEKRKRVLHGRRIVKGRQEGAAQREWRIQERYDFSQKQGKVPFFGVSKPDSPSYGLDWVQTKSLEVPSMGFKEDVPKSTWHNIQGYAGSWQPNPNIPKMPSHARRFPSGPTDQKSFGKGGSPVSKWDGKVRHLGGARPSYLSGERKTGKTQPEASIRQDPYSFY